MDTDVVGSIHVVETFIDSFVVSGTTPPIGECVSLDGGLVPVIGGGTAFSVGGAGMT